MRPLPLLWLAAAATLAASPVEMRPDPRSAGDAVRIGQSRQDRTRAAFHAPYHLPVRTPPVDYVEVVTPFRRIVLAAQARADAGDRSFGQRQALELLTDPPELEIWVELTFHPQNTFVGVPDYVVTLVDGAGARVPAAGLIRHPRHGPRLEGTPLPLPVPGGLTLPETSEPLLGGTIVARFDGRRLDPARAYDLLIEDGPRELGRVRVDLGKLR
jgi:hypothetical protein